MKYILTQRDLELIRRMSIDNFAKTPNPAYEAQYHNILCVIRAFVRCQELNNNSLQVCEAVRQNYESVDEDS